MLRRVEEETESTVDIKTLVYTEKTSLRILKLSKTKLIQNTKTKNKRLFLLFGLRAFTYHIDVGHGLDHVRQQELVKIVRELFDGVHVPGGDQHSRPLVRQVSLELVTAEEALAVQGAQ